MILKTNHYDTIYKYSDLLTIILVATAVIFDHLPYSYIFLAVAVVMIAVRNIAALQLSKIRLIYNELRFQEHEILCEVRKELESMPINNSPALLKSYIASKNAADFGFHRIHD